MTDTLGKTSYGRYILPVSERRAAKFIFLLLTLWFFCSFHFIFIPHFPNFEINSMVTCDKYILWIFPLDWLKAELLKQYCQHSNKWKEATSASQLELSLPSSSPLAASAFSCIDWWMACNVSFRRKPKQPLWTWFRNSSLCEFILHHALLLNSVTRIIWL